MNAALKLPEPSAPALLSWRDYEAAEAASDVRHEFFTGRVYAMAGASDNHNRIALSIASAMERQLRGKPCEPFVSDMKLRVSLARNEFGYYPDVMVVCDPRGIHGTHVTRPTVIVEVLSDSTRATDLREKRFIYQSIRSLEAYIVVDQSRAEVTIFRRADQWTGETLTSLRAAVELPEIGVRLPLSTIYARVSWREKKKA